MPPSKHPSLKIRLGSKGSPGPDSSSVNHKSASPSVTDRQKGDKQAQVGVNGQRPTSSNAATASPVPKGPSRSASESTQGPAAGKAQSPPVTNGVKIEARSTQSPYLGVQPVTVVQDGQPPPSSQSLVASGHTSTLPTGLNQQSHTGSPYPPVAQQPLYTFNPNYENKIRGPGRCKFSKARPQQYRPFIELTWLS